MKKKVALQDFLTDIQIKKAIELKEVALICDKIIKPNINEINAKIGQENDPDYLAYATHYVISRLN